MNTMESHSYHYLSNIHSPKDLKELSGEEMPRVAEEIRQELVRIVSGTGGHLASNLGVVELTLALHRVFDCPKDHIIFDVGHQSYVHKMLTGRYDRMETIRQAGGLSGFPNRSESEYDCFGTGHSSTSLSAALGFAISDRLQGSDSYTVAVVGDGAYTGGMIHEALNNCQKDLKLIIIMNENEMSISKNIGRFATNLAKLRTKSGYFKTKKATGVFLKRIPWVGKRLFYVVRGVKKSIKNVLYGSNYFESMGLTYLGPIDGNDYEAVENLLREAKKMDESVVLHLKTKKGKGYAPAELAPDVYHGMVPKWAQKNKEQTFSQYMGSIICQLAAKDQCITAITAAMCDGTGLCEFKEKYPDRFFDVGIAEEHALTFAAGLSANGMRPFTAIYSTFLQRGYDNIVHDIALQNLPCIVCVDRAGLNGGDGATHHGIFDVAFLSQIPNVSIYTPITLNALTMALRDAYDSGKPCAIRYPNGSESQAVVNAFYPNGIAGKPGVVCNYRESDSPSCVIVTHGRIVEEALRAADRLKEEGISVGIVLLERIKPYKECAQQVANILPLSAHGVIFLEEEIRSGGMGMNLSDYMARFCGLRRFKILATEDSFVAHRMNGQSIYDAAGVSVRHIMDAVRELEEEFV
ncbi:MAG: 1-deoxy-D-xylulose-5-phosphate synthase [Clostridia bacterium]|nr:1-deoxy-D-xylulose-5-phosphate synthase [Clostridia bacterium]